MAHSIEFSSSADKELDALSGDVRTRILKAVSKLSSNPRPSGCKKLKAQDAYRIRVGAYRVIYEIRDAVLIVWVIKVGHRSNVYQG